MTNEDHKSTECQEIRKARSCMRSQEKFPMDKLETVKIQTQSSVSVSCTIELYYCFSYRVLLSSNAPRSS